MFVIPKPPSTTLKVDHKSGDKIIKTTDWGDFKIRKNGRLTMMVEDEVVRVTPLPTKEREGV